MCDLSAKVAELHATMAALRRESEQKIEKLKAENEEATKAIERLQSQLKQQTDFNSLKNNLMWVEELSCISSNIIETWIEIKVVNKTLLIWYKMD